MSKVKPKDKPHYVNNRDFSEAVYDYVVEALEADERGETRPVVTSYIGDCFIRIAQGLAHRSNFIQYPYRDEMVMDAVENCLKAIQNYDISKTTRTGKPNAFSYFTQISWYAFLRRIAKEKRQLDIKTRLIEKGGYDEFFNSDGEGSDETNGVVDRLRSYSLGVQEDRTEEKNEQTPPKPHKPQGLENFIDEE